MGMSRHDRWRSLGDRLADLPEVENPHASGPFEHPAVPIIVRETRPPARWVSRLDQFELGARGLKHRRRPRILVSRSHESERVAEQKTRRDGGRANAPPIRTEEVVLVAMGLWSSRVEPADTSEAAGASVGLAQLRKKLGIEHTKL